MDTGVPRRGKYEVHARIEDRGSWIQHSRDSQRSNGVLLQVAQEAFDKAKLNKPTDIDAFEAAERDVRGCREGYVRRGCRGKLEAAEKEGEREERERIEREREERERLRG